MNFSKKISVGEILFSNGTYEVEVIEEGKREPFWPFLQLDEDGNILDCFCSCEESEAGKCRHIKAAYLKIFDGKEPLHIIFSNSFWKRFFEGVSKRVGYDATFSKRGKSFELSDGSLVIEPKDIKSESWFFEIVKKKKETEETSIKFSRLSLEELSLYRKGEASNELLFELSIFSDIAKWLFFLARDDDYRVEFLEGEGLPLALSIYFPSLFLGGFFKRRELEEIIPTLGDLKSSLKLFSYKDAIEKVSYDSENRIFLLEKKRDVEERLARLRERGGISVGEWIYIAGRGFLKRDVPRFFVEGRIDDVEGFLDEKGELSRYLEERVSYVERECKYHLSFYKMDLHIRIYLFSEDDFLKKGSDIFGRWAYIFERGFYRLKRPMFKGVELVVLKDEVSDFINSHREFFQGIEGFETHLGGFEEELRYRVVDRELQFYSELILPEGIDEVIDFGSWVYVKDRGFYSKVVRDLPIRPGMVVRDVDSFIGERSGDLEQVVNFFTDENPIERIGIVISINDEGCLEVTPKVYKRFSCSLKFFENYVYVEGRGFFELGVGFKLPKKYRKRVVIPKEKEKGFIDYEMRELKPFILDVDRRLKPPKKMKFFITEVVKREGRFFLKAEYRSEIGSILLLDILRDIKKRRYIFSEAGLLDLKAKRFDWLREIKKEDVSLEFLKVNLLKLLGISLYEEVFSEGECKKSLDEIYSLTADRPLDFIRFNGELWPYQKIGAFWLWSLYCNGLSGILADEMGLGKTIQAISLIASIMGYHKRRFIVICPTSVIYHWEELLKDFLRDVKVLVFHGARRKLTSDFDILLTSYGLIRQDSEIKDLDFEVAIFDEIQIAKNQLSKTHRSLKKIKARMILGLTGTPIENRIMELKALFDLVLPSFFPREGIFREQFVDPIEKEGKREKKELLSRVIGPFLLRRRKKDVLLDLPEKIEEISYVDLLGYQKELYQEILDMSRVEIVGELKDADRPVNYVHIFSTLSKLKRVCDHPALIVGDIKGYKRYPSGKFELFCEILSEARESGRKVVVFSQYLGMLDIFESYLKEMQIKFASIRGSTIKRQEEIKKFQEEDCEVFLASLMAAGVGIDLSAASVVIHYDRWWNIAKENQATSRVHRAGQSRGVQVFKLVSKGSIEERIHTIIERKRGLVEEVIETDDVGEIRRLSRKELLEIMGEIG